MPTIIVANPALARLCTIGESRITEERTPRSASFSASIAPIMRGIGGGNTFVIGSVLGDEFARVRCAQNTKRHNQWLAGVTQRVAHRPDSARIALRGAREIAEVRA